MTTNQTLTAGTVLDPYWRPKTKIARRKAMAARRTARERWSNQ
jgi:hypothetical protein